MQKIRVLIRKLEQSDIQEIADAFHAMAGINLYHNMNAIIWSK